MLTILFTQTQILVKKSSDFGGNTRAYIVRLWFPTQSPAAIQVRSFHLPLLFVNHLYSPNGYLVPSVVSQMS